MTISIEDYFGPRGDHTDATAEMRSNAGELLARVNALLAEASAAGCYAGPVDADTKSCVSGSYNPSLAHGYSGDGGFRSRDAKTGGPGSRHRKAQAVDVYDPSNVLDSWINDDVLVRHSLWREHPSATKGWCHLQSAPPGSGTRSYYP